MDNALEGKRITDRLVQLKTYSDSYIPTWQSLCDTSQSYRGRFQTEDKTTILDSKNASINNRGGAAANILAAGLMRGVSSPSVPWITFVTKDKKAMERPLVKRWLSDVADSISSILNTSNLYKEIHTLYSELGLFGTGALGIYEDEETVIRAECYTIGSYHIDVDEKGRVNTFYRELTMTLADIIAKFKKDKIGSLPDELEMHRERKEYHVMFNVIHAIEPNIHMNMDSQKSVDKKFRSTYILTDCQDKGVLHVSGYNEFPIMCPRWDTKPGQVYGSGSPGMNALGAILMLQNAEEKKYEAIAKQINPPVVVNASLRNVPKVGLKPGQVIQVEDINSAVQRVYNIEVNYEGLKADIMGLEQRIDESFFRDLFQQMLGSDRREMTAMEVAVRESESLLAIGPILTRLFNELLDPLTDRVYNIAARKNLLPTFLGDIEDLKGGDIEVVYISPLAKSQKQDTAVNLIKIVEFVRNVDASYPGSTYKLNPNKLIDSYSSAIGISPDIIVSTEEATEMQMMQQEAQAEQQQAQMAMDAAKVAPGLINSLGKAQEMEGIDIG